MKTFQLDASNEDKKIFSFCHNDKGIKTYRLPKQFKSSEGFKPGIDDISLLKYCKINEYILVTIDKKIATEHEKNLFDKHPGFVIVGFAPPITKTLTRKDFLSILGYFKINFAKWKTINNNNSIIEITQVYVNVYHVNKGKLLQDVHLKFENNQWIRMLENVLKVNSSR